VVFIGRLLVGVVETIFGPVFVEVLSLSGPGLLLAVVAGSLSLHRRSLLGFFALFGLVVVLLEVPLLLVMFEWSPKKLLAGFSVLVGCTLGALRPKGVALSFEQSDELHFGPN